MIKKLYFAICRRIIAFICLFLPVQKNKIVASSYYGRGYGDNPKYIVEYLNSRIKSKKIIWLVKNEKEAANLPKNVIPCIYGSLKCVYHLGTAKVWINNCRSFFIFKKKNQFYINTWHGFGPKKIEADAEDKLSTAYVKAAKKDSKAIDLLISNSASLTNIYRKTFWYNGKIMEWGFPRCDIFNDKNKLSTLSAKVKEYYSIDSSTKIILYVPTFRANHSLTPYSIDIKNLTSACKNKFGGDFIFMFRLHPNIAHLSAQLFGNNAIDATDYDDLQELLAASDIVISDYSSASLDYILIGRPCFCFATDIEDYKKDRDFYFPYESMPFPISRTNGELIENIKSFDYSNYIESISAFIKKHGMLENYNASAACFEYLIDNNIIKL